MDTLEKEIEEVKRKHASLELQKYRDNLHALYQELKKTEGTVECRVMKTSKTTRYVHLVHHISYELATDSWKRPEELEHQYIAQKFRTISIMETAKAPNRRCEIKIDETTPTSYGGKRHFRAENHGYDFSTKLTRIGVDEFNAIWELVKTTGVNVLDGILDIKEVRWVMNGTSDDRHYDEKDLNGKTTIDIPHIVLSHEESYKLDNQYCRLFLNKNIYFITANSIAALDEWLSYELRSDSFFANACASVGERWRGSRADEYRVLVSKIKAHRS